MTIYYFKHLDYDGKITSILTYNNYHPNITDSFIVEITEDEYNTLLAEIQAADASESDEISDGEALNIILGVSE